jgi:hypothetical protein
MEDVITHFPEELLDTKKMRRKKRTSEAMEDATHISESPEDSTKRMRYSSISSLPDDLPVGTPKKMPTELETEPFTMSSLPGRRMRIRSPGNPLIWTLSSAASKMLAVS